LNQKEENLMTPELTFHSLFWVLFGGVLLMRLIPNIRSWLGW
jgi:hypothetical protein